jgi:hypothetical protein
MKIPVESVEEKEAEEDILDRTLVDEILSNAMDAESEWQDLESRITERFKRYSE